MQLDRFRLGDKVPVIKSVHVDPVRVYVCAFFLGVCVCVCVCPPALHLPCAAHHAEIPQNSLCIVHLF